MAAPQVLLGGRSPRVALLREIAAAIGVTIYERPFASLTIYVQQRLLRTLTKES